MSLEVAAVRSDEKRIQDKHSAELLRRSRSRPTSPDRYSLTPRERDRYPSAEALSDRRLSAVEPSAQYLSQHRLSAYETYKSRDATMTPTQMRKAYSASDSSLEDEENNMYGIHHQRRRSRKMQRQKRSLTDVDVDPEVAMYYHQQQQQLPLAHSQSYSDKEEKYYRDNIIDINVPVRYRDEPHLRHISSDAGIYTQNEENARRKSSESSDVSELRFSPPPDSLTPSSPDYMRSPRESADSDMLGLPSIGPYPTQRRSIPSVVVDPNHLSLNKEAQPRRGSTGRALPQIPVEQARSMLDLPHGRTGSSHSLDLPMQEQPRRASAPECENIKIVIDDVDSAPSPGRTRSSIQYERVVLHRDDTDPSTRTKGFGLVVMGGKLNDTDGILYAYVSSVVPGGPADKMAVKAGDKIIAWDGKSLLNCTYEQVRQIIESSTNVAELIIEPAIKT